MARLGNIREKVLRTLPRCTLVNRIQQYKDIIEDMNNKIKFIDRIARERFGDNYVETYHKNQRTETWKNKREIDLRKNEIAKRRRERAKIVEEKYKHLR